MKHNENLYEGTFTSKSGIDYSVIVDKYSGNNYKVIRADEQINHIVGKFVHRNHSFTRGKAINS